MESFLRKVLVVLFSLAAFGSHGWAQIPRGGDVFIGYSFSQGETNAGALGTRGSNMNGWEGSAEAKFLPWIGLVGDFDWHYGGADFATCAPAPCTPQKSRVNASRHNLLFGPRASMSFGKYTPFAEFLMGIAHQVDSGAGVSVVDNSFATAIGGGLDYRLIKGFAWRVQADSIHSGLFGPGGKDLRLSTGLVIIF